MTKSTISIINGSSINMEKLDTNSIDLIVTSPPYPMIEMWDDCFASQSDDVKKAISEQNWRAAFFEMHKVLNKTWDECDRVLKENGFVCINIGDATRTCNGEFQLFSNHTKIIEKFEAMGYSVLPDIHWRKQTTAPNKFMGSGMYPAGAYVTYEHEYILVFRKGGKRVFKGDSKTLRQQSAYFWEERNTWFSDLWEIKGVPQVIKDSATRKRSAAYPFEIPYRLINMYSAYNDNVLDPFGGLSTTALACASSHRNCFCYEIDSELCKMSGEALLNAKEYLKDINAQRLERHLAFIESLPNDKLGKCYVNNNHNFKVKTKQETEALFYQVESIEKLSDEMFQIEYKKWGSG